MLLWRNKGCQIAKPGVGIDDYMILKTHEEFMDAVVNHMMPGNVVTIDSKHSFTVMQVSNTAVTCLANFSIGRSDVAHMDWNLRNLIGDPCNSSWLRELDYGHTFRDFGDETYLRLPLVEEVFPKTIAYLHITEYIKLDTAIECWSPITSPVDRCLPNNEWYWLGNRISDDFGTYYPVCCLNGTAIDVVSEKRVFDVRPVFDILKW